MACRWLVWKPEVMNLRSVRRAKNHGAWNQTHVLGKQMIAVGCQYLLMKVKTISTDETIVPNIRNITISRLSVSKIASSLNMRTKVNNINTTNPT